MNHAGVVNNQQRAAQGGTGGSPIWAAVIPAPAIVDCKNQSWSITARVVSQTRVPLLALHCRVRSAFFSVCRGDLHRHRRSAFSLLPRRGATLIRRSRLARGPQYRFSGHLPCRDTDLLEAHFDQRLSAFVGFDDRDRDMKGEPRAGTPFWKAGNVFR